MATQERSARALQKSLRRKQEKHVALLIKVEKTTARLERRRLKLQSLESEIADLERRVVDPRARNAAGSDSEQSLREAMLIFNPASGTDRKDNTTRLAHIVGALRSHGIHATIGLKTSGKAARALAREAARGRHPLVLVAGGDGTIEDVMSQLVGSETTLGIIPIGTMNNLARSLGVPLDIDDACALAAMHTVRHIDVGRVFSNDRPHVEYFLEGAGVGLSAVAAFAGQSVEKHHWRFVPRALRKLFETRPRKIEVVLDGTVIEASSSIVTVSNAPLMGGNLLVAPDAKMDDGLLDVTVYDGMGTTDLMKHFMAAAKGEPLPLQTYRARQVRITAEVAQATNSDKDMMPQRRVVEIEIVPKALSMIVGNGIGLTVPVEAAPAAPPLSGNPPEMNGQAEPSVESSAATI